MRVVGCRNSPGSPRDERRSARRCVENRAQSLTLLDVCFGDHGFDYAQRIYDQLDDRQIVTNFRLRQTHGLVDVDQMRDYAPMARMLL